jgi:hypothetical protein
MVRTYKNAPEVTATDKTRAHDCSGGVIDAEESMDESISLCVIARNIKQCHGLLEHPKLSTRALIRIW